MRSFTRHTPLQQRTPPLLALLMAFSLVAAACGSTAESEGEAAGDRTRETEQGSIDEPGAEPEAEEERSETGGTAPLGAEDGNEPGESGEPGEPAAQAAPDDAASAQAAGSAGLTDDTIRVGFEIVDDDAGETNRRLGISEVAARDEDREAFVNLIVEDINTRGGVAGREVEPVIHVSDENDSAEVRAQRTCAAFTEDNEVFTVSLYSHFTNGTVRRCLQERGVPMVTGGLSLADNRVFEQTDEYVEVENLSLTRIPEAQIRGLVEQGFFDDDSTLDDPVRIGLVRLDSAPFERATEESLKPALARHGLELTEEVAVTHSQSNQQLGGQANEVNNAVLRFRSSGITHVLFLQDRPSASLFFMMQAESQGYRPLYGLNTQDGGQLIANAVPPEQLEGAMGVGWKPFIDVPTGEDPGTNDAREHCLELMRDGGQEFSDRNSMLVAQVHCDMGYFIQAAGDAAAPSLTTESFMAGVRSLETSFEAGQTWRTNFGDSLDGVAAYRTTAYSMDCECFQYTSDLREAPH